MSEFNMTKEQKDLFDALTTLQQEIALNSLSGMNDIDSYKASSGKSIKESTMSATVCEILKNPKVVAFMDAMKKSIVSDKIMSRERMMEIQTMIADVSALDIENMTLESLTEFKNGFDVKLKAMNQLAELGGYKSAAKFEHSSPDGTMSPVRSLTDDELLRIASEKG